MAVKTIDPKKHIITYKGVPITGFADGEFINIAPGAEDFTKGVGADGEVARVKSNDNTYEVTITLLQTSVSNDYLSSQRKIDQLTGLGAGPLSIVDLSGTTVFFFAAAWIRQNPDSNTDKSSVGERAWVFDTDNAINDNVGGNI